MAGWQQIARQAAQRHGVDPNIFVRQIQAESGGNPNAVSPAGAIGIAQFIPSTARQFGINPRNPVQSLDAAAKYMAQNLRRTGGNYAQALSLYNSGRPDGYKTIAETRGYVQKILAGKNPTGGGGGGGGAGTTIPGLGALKLTTAQVVPGADRSAARRQITAQYLLGRPSLGRLLQLQQGLLANQDDPSTVKLGSRTLPGQQPITIGGGPPPAGKGLKTFEGKPVAAWIAPILQYARRQGWKGTITSGYRSVAEQARIYNSGQRPAAKPGQSNHQFTGYPGGAVDVSDPQGLAAVIARSKYRGLLTWAGAKDPPHFSHPHNGGY